MSAKPALRVVGDEAEPPIDDRALADFGRDDIGNAERLIERHGQDLRRTTGLGVFVYDGKRWKIDPDELLALIRAQKTARAILKEAKAISAEAGETNDTEAKKEIVSRAAAHRKWATSSANSQRLKSMMAQAWPHLDVPFESWNAKRESFNVLNGTLDLSDLEPKLRAHRRDDLITHVAGVEYDPDAECPHFRAYIDRVLPPVEIGEGKFDRSLQKFVQRVLGACLIDSASDRCIVVFHGGGSNGKSTVLNVVSAVLGDYSLTAAIESLLYNDNKTGSGPSPDIARLAERPRLVRVSEPEVGARLSEGGVKGITGGEPITARKLQKDIIEFLPNFKVILSCNNRPLVKGSDDGIWDRILLVPWRTRFSDEEKRTNGARIVAEINSELPGILNWLLEGLEDYKLAGGLNPPAEVLEASMEYRADSDAVGRFINACCELGKDREQESGELYDAYKMWAKEEGADRLMSANGFGKRLTDRGFGRRKSASFVYRLGIELTGDTKVAVRSGKKAEKDKSPPPDVPDAEDDT